MGLCAMASVAAGAGNIEIIVDNSLYAGGQITDSLNQYVADLQAQGYTPTLTTIAFATAAQLRTHLANTHATSGLAGAVFVGDLPVFDYEIAAHVGWNYESFPCDLYYQDLDGIWADNDSNGKYDAHTGDVAPEIWMGRLTVSTLTGLGGGRTEAQMLNDYFDKDHSYRRRTLRVSEDGLAYIDDDWTPWATEWSNALAASVSGSTTIVTTNTVQSDYEYRLANEQYESALVALHSAPTYHTYKEGGDWTGEYTYSNELDALDPDILFYNLFACKNALYTATDYMAGEYVFGTDSGLLAVGTTKTGSMLEFEDYYDPIAVGETFGEAWLDWWLARAAGGFTQSEQDWHYGMTMLGDPTLMMQTFMAIDGDCDLDGDVDINDLSALAASWDFPAGMGWANGDFDADEDVDINDLSALAGNWGYGTAGGMSFDEALQGLAVPEPTTLGILALGACLAARRRKAPLTRASRQSERLALACARGSLSALARARAS